MADYWRYADGRTTASVTLHAAPPAAQVPNVLPVKRQRTDMPEVPGQPQAQYPGYPQQAIGQVAMRETENIDASYENYLRNGVPYGANYGMAEVSRPIQGGLPPQPVDDRLMMGVGLGDGQIGFGGGVRPELSRRLEMPLPLPPDASNTLYVEGLPANCTRREVCHIFRPFVGYREVRLVNKGSRLPSGDPLVLCFVDFSNPGQAAVALEALQGYKFDEQEHDSPCLRLQFARFAGPRSGGSRARR